MSIYVIDYESYYSSKDKFGLKNMTTEAYINSPKFHCFGFSVKKEGGNALWVPEEKCVTMLRQLRLHEHAVVAHNAAFDMAILNWRYGVRPKFIIDTLSMARALLGTEEKLSLDALAERFELGKKGDTVLHMDGVRHPSSQMAKKLGEYACNDADLEWALWKELSPHFTMNELKVIDITVRMYTEPSFILDPVPIAREILLGEEQKHKLLTLAGCTLDDLRSDAKFALVLESLGVTPPMKLSAKKTAAAQAKDPKAPAVYAYAFAKSDADFKAMAESEDDLVRWACEARLGLKSTIKESRSARFRSVQERFGVMPVALDYFGANTGRYTASRSAAMNMQNLPSARGSDDPDAALLRAALTAPPGQFVVVADLAQIEARIVVWLAGQENVVEAFRQGRDVYSEMASVIFNRPVDKGNPDDFLFRFIGKATILGCGYSLGHMKFASMIYTGMLGMKGIVFDEKMVEDVGADVRGYVKFLSGKQDLVDRLKELKPARLSAGEWIRHSACAFKIINTYRERNSMVPRLWKTCETILAAMATGSGETIMLTDSVGESIVQFPTRRDAMLMPNGMWMHFKDLTRDDDGQYTCLRRKDGRVKRVKTYGGAVLENCLTGDTKVYTLRGLVSIPNVKHDDMVWDGLSWVTTDGAVRMGRKEIGVWLGVGITQEHLITDGKRWLPVIALGESASSDALKWARDSARLPLFAQGWGTSQKRCSGATVEKRKAATLEGYTDVMAQQRVRNVTVRPLGHARTSISTCSRRRKLDRCGCIGIVEWLVDAATKAAQHIKIMGLEVLVSMQNGLPIELCFSLTPNHCLDGKTLPSTWTGLTTNEDMNQETSGSYLGKKIAGTGVIVPRLHTSEHNITNQTSGKNFALGGKAGVPLRTTSASDGQQNGLWKSTTREEEVFDLLNCGRNHRFMIETNSGPAIVHNCAQNLAGIITKDGMVRMNARGYRPVLQVHDEIVALSYAPELALEEMVECMTVVPDWAAGLPLAAEGGYGESYRDAK